MIKRSLSQVLESFYFTARTLSRQQKGDPLLMWRLGLFLSWTVSESENKGQKKDRALYLQEEELVGDKLVNK